MEDDQLHWEELIGRLETEYRIVRPSLDRFVAAIVAHLTESLEQVRNVLALPVQARVKEWDSIDEKLERKPRAIQGISELGDLIGLRVVVLFRPDLLTIRDIIKSTFEVVEEDDKREHLKDSQFGYSSVHYSVEFTRDWLAQHGLVEYAELNLRGEIQVRTLAEHYWASAEHILQYKQKSAPDEIRREIARLSALLEEVEAGFERVRTRKLEQQQIEVEALPITQRLDVDSLAHVLDENLPSPNKEQQELYADLLEDLFHFGVDTPSKLRKLLAQNKKAILEEDAESVRAIKEALRGGKGIITIVPGGRDRLDRGVYFSHVGLTRAAMRLAYGDAWDDYWRDKGGEEGDK